jgi:hypothetical protein
VTVLLMLWVTTARGRGPPSSPPAPLPLNAYDAVKMKNKRAREVLA